MAEVQTTATVETLTAEVRVLMVGKRQITASVAKQLDRVALGTVDPFGRVRVKIDNHEDYVIGRDVRSGNLVVAAYSTRLPKFPTVPGGGIGAGHIEICCPDHMYNARNSTLWFAGSTPELSAWLQGCVEFKRTFSRKCSSATGAIVTWSDACREWLEEKIPPEREALHRRNAPHEAAANLPLIVLAGLR